MPIADTAAPARPMSDVWRATFAERTQLSMELDALREDIAQLRADLFPRQSALIVGPEAMKLFSQLPKV